jgi:hypothetical protein
MKITARPIHAPRTIERPISAKVIADAKKLFTGKQMFVGLNDAALGGKDTAVSKRHRITYARLPAVLAKQYAKTDPKAEWAPTAYKAVVDGHSIFAVVDGIDDEGFNVSLYDQHGKQLASGGTYRSDLPDWNAA